MEFEAARFAHHLMKDYEEKYTKLMGYLCGKSMDAGQWAFVRETLGIPKGTTVKAV